MISDKEIEIIREQGMVSRCCKKDVIIVNGAAVQHYCCTKCGKPCELTIPQESGTVNVVPAKQEKEEENGK